MGGHGAIKLGMLFPEVFCSIYALSPYVLGLDEDYGIEGEAFKQAQKIESRGILIAGYKNLNANAVIAAGRAFSPNPNQPPFYANLPYRYVGDSLIIKYDALEPVVVGLGVQRSDPGWEFTPHDEHPLMGSKFLYLIVQKPRQVDAVRLSLRVAAEVETRQGLFSARTRHQDRERLSTVICAD